MPDIDMWLVGSRLSRSSYHYRERRYQGSKILPQVATSGAAESGGFSNQRFRMYAMTELKEFSDREKNEERARNWISKVKLASLRE